MSRIFIADSDQKFVSLSSSYLTLSGYTVSEFSDLSSLKDTLRSFFPDLLLIARSFPDGDGLMFLKQIRAKNPMTIIVIYMLRKTLTLACGMKAVFYLEN